MMVDTCFTGSVSTSCYILFIHYVKCSILGLTRRCITCATIHSNFFDIALVYTTILLCNTTLFNIINKTFAHAHLRCPLSLTLHCRNLHICCMVYVFLKCMTRNFLSSSWKDLLKLYNNFFCSFSFPFF